MPLGTQDCLLFCILKRFSPCRHCILISAAFTGSVQAGEAQVPSTSLMLHIQVPHVGAATNAIWREKAKPKMPGQKICTKPVVLASWPPSPVCKTYSSQDTVPVFTLVLKHHGRLLSLTFTIWFLSALLSVGALTTAPYQQESVHAPCYSRHWERFDQFPLFLAQHQP